MSRVSKKENKLTPAAQEFVSNKIRILIEEGYDLDQAKAIAYSMARQKGYKAGSLSGLWEILKIEAKVVNAFSLSRFMTHIKSGIPFCFITSWKSEDSIKVNKDNFEALKKDLTNMGTGTQFGYEHIQGSWKDPSTGMISYEPSLFVIDLSLPQAIHLSSRYKQDAVLWGQYGDGVYLIDRNGSIDKMTDTPTFDTAKIEECYTTWHGRTFAFNKEYNLVKKSYILPPINGWLSAMSTNSILKDKLAEKYGYAVVDLAIQDVENGKDPEDALEWMIRSSSINRVFLDDARDVPEEGWIGARTAQEAISLLEAGSVGVISLDHDLGEESNGTGMDVINWIESKVHEDDNWEPPHMYVHSANPVGRANMERAIKSIMRYVDNRPNTKEALSKDRRIDYWWRMENQISNWVKHYGKDWLISTLNIVFDRASNILKDWYNGKEDDKPILAILRRHYLAEARHEFTDYDQHKDPSKDKYEYTNRGFGGRWSLSDDEWIFNKLRDSLLSAVGKSGSTDQISYDGNYYIANSNVHGDGVFSSRGMGPGELVGVAMHRFDNTGYPDKDIRRTSLGRYVNESKDNPNASVQEDNGVYKIFTLKPIKPNEEILVDYTPFFDMIYPEETMYGDTNG